MFTLSGKCALFIGSTAALLLAGSAVKVEVRERGRLVTVGGSSGLVISGRAYGALKPKRSDWFRYREGGREFSSRIVSVRPEGEGWRLSLAGVEGSSPLRIVSYRLGRMGLWSEVVG